MSKYESVCTAISMVEACRRLFSMKDSEFPRASRVVEDLQDIAKDVRYGGRWEGDRTGMAESLESCAAEEKLCSGCIYRDAMTRGETVSCTSHLKRFAAKLIRSQEEEIRQLKREIKRWQMEVMERGGPEEKMDLGADIDPFEL